MNLDTLMGLIAQQGRVIKAAKTLTNELEILNLLGELGCNAQAEEVTRLCQKHENSLRALKNQYSGLTQNYPKKL